MRKITAAATSLLIIGALAGCSAGAPPIEEENTASETAAPSAPEPLTEESFFVAVASLYCDAYEAPSLDQKEFGDEITSILERAVDLPVLAEPSGVIAHDSQTWSDVLEPGTGFADYTGSFDWRATPASMDGNDIYPWGADFYGVCQFAGNRDKATDEAFVHQVAIDYTTIMNTGSL